MSRESVAALVALLAILATVVAIHAHTLHDSFHGDDFVAFTEFKTLGFWEYCRQVFLFQDNNFYWRPLGSIFHYALYEGFGMEPFAFRLAALLFFLATLVCLYLFCRGEGLGRLVALGSVLVFGLFPNHVISVTWVTNTSRLAAGLFLLVCLLLQQRSRGARFAFAWECLAYLAFVAAALNDETTTALAPLPFLYATFVARRNFEWKGALLRLVMYAAVVCVIVPLQFTYTIDDEARLTQYGFGPHILTTVWVLASQLTLPLAEGSPVAVIIHLMPAAQWAAGLAFIALCVVLFLAGSRTTRFLVVWVGLGFAPFALWHPQDISPRYVYLAAMPFAILASWLFMSAAMGLWRRLAAMPDLPALARFAVPVAALAILLPATVIATQATLSRNEAWSRETAKYGVLRDALESEFPTLPPGTRLIVLYGEWPDFWASSVARAIYGDFSIWVTSIPRERVDTAEIRTNPNDVLVYLLHDRMMSVNSRR